MRKRHILIFLFLYNGFLYSCDDILIPFKFECNIQDEYRNLKNSFGKEKIEFLSSYRTNRFVNVKKNEKFHFPWEISKPIPEKWIFWELSNHLLKAKMDGIANRQIQIEREFLDLTKRISFNFSSKYNSSKFGKFRGTESKPFICINLAGRASDYILKKFEFKFQNGSPIIGLSKKPKICPANQFHLTFPTGKEAAMEFKRLMGFAQSEHQKIINKQPSMSPYALMAYLQKWYFAIQPFEGGLEITGKLLQDIFSYLYDLPFVPGESLTTVFSTPLDFYKEQTKKRINLLISEIKNCLGTPESVECKNIYDINGYSSSPKSIKNFTDFKEVLFEKCYNKLSEPCYQLLAFDFSSKLNIKGAKRHPYQKSLDGKVKECSEVLFFDDFKKNRKTNLIEYSQDNLELISAKERKCSDMLSKDERISIQSYSSEKKVTEEGQAGQDEAFVNLFDEEDVEDIQEPMPNESQEKIQSREYKEINNMARRGKRTEKIDNLYLGLKKMTGVAGNIILWRGSIRDPKFRTGNYLKNNTFMSTSILFDVAKIFALDEKKPMKKKVFMKIVSHFSAKSIMTLSNFPEEMEMIFLPGSQFKVLSRQENEDLIIYNLMEV